MLDVPLTDPPDDLIDPLSVGSGIPIGWTFPIAPSEIDCDGLLRLFVEAALDAGIWKQLRERENDRLPRLAA